MPSFPTVQGKQRLQAPTVTRTFLADLSAGAHLYESRKSPTDQYAKTTQAFSTWLLPPGTGHQAPYQPCDAKVRRPTCTCFGGAHKWACCPESVNSDLSRVGSAWVLSPLPTRNTRKPSSLHGPWTRTPLQEAYLNLTGTGGSLLSLPTSIPYPTRSSPQTARGTPNKSRAYPYVTPSIWNVFFHLVLGSSQIIFLSSSRKPPLTIKTRFCALSDPALRPPAACIPVCYGCLLPVCFSR